MTEMVFGNLIALNINANELTRNDYIYRLPDGYSVRQMKIIGLNTAVIINTNMSLTAGTYEFPPVNCKSPSAFHMYILDISKPTYVRISIEKFGQIPDEHYFDMKFTPILVTGDDGNEYHVIPSEQFK